MPWFRLHDRILENKKVSRLPDSAFRFWINCMCMACRENADGDTGKTVEELSWVFRITDDEALQAFQCNVTAALLETGETGTVTVLNWSEWQNRDTTAERVRRHRQKKKEEAAAQVAEQNAKAGETEAIVTLYETLQKRKHVTDKIRLDEIRLDIETPTAVGVCASPPARPHIQAKGKADICPYEDIIAVWNSQPKLVKCIKMAEPRRRLMRARWREELEQDLQNWEDLCRWISKQEFYTGGGNRGWVIDIDFILRPSQMQKLIEAMRAGSGDLSLADRMAYFQRMQEEIEDASC